MVEGAQVALEQTMPKQLTRLLGGGQGGGTRPLDTINAGNAGFGTAQELLFLEREGPSYQPDLVVLVYYVDNDTANNGIAIARKLGLSTAHRPYFDLAADGSLHQVDRAEAVPDTLGRVDDFFRAHSLLYSVGENLLTAKSFAKQYHAMRMGEDAATYKIEATREWRSAWAVTEALLKRARASSDALGAELLVVCAPSQFQLDDEAWEKLIGSDRASVMARYRQDVPNRRLEEAAGRAGVRFLDLLPGFQMAAQADATPLYFEEDGHWTASGHALAARLIAAYLHEQGLLNDDGEEPRVADRVGGPGAVSPAPAVGRADQAPRRAFAVSSRSITRSRPSTSIVSKSGGETLLNVLATRSDMNNCPVLTPRLAASSRRLASRVAWSNEGAPLTIAVASFSKRRGGRAVQALRDQQRVVVGRPIGVEEAEQLRRLAEALQALLDQRQDRLQRRIVRDDAGPLQERPDALGQLGERQLADVVPVQPVELVQVEDRAGRC